MAKFPVEISDGEGIVDAVNNLLSGPAGLGQNFAGFSERGTDYFTVTGNYRPPYTIKLDPTGVDPCYLWAPTNPAGIALGACEMLDERTWLFYFASPPVTVLGYPLFKLGNGVTIKGVTDSYYDGDYNQIGVVECTDTYFVVRTSQSYPIVAPSSGGTASMNLTNQLVAPATFNDLDRANLKYCSTDCNARVTVTSQTDRVFISGQLSFFVQYYVNTGYSLPNELAINVTIDRFIAVPNYDPVNPDYKFIYQDTIAETTFELTDLPGTGSIGETSNYDAIFTSIIDIPGPGYYWYILQVAFFDFSDPLTFPDGKVHAITLPISLRSLTAQVVKQ